MTNKELEAQVAELKAQLEAQPACADVDLATISPDVVLEAQGFTPEEIANIVKAKGRREFDARVSSIPGSEAVSAFKQYVIGLNFPVRIVFELPKADAEVNVSTHRPTGKDAGPKAGRGNGQMVQYIGEINLLAVRDGAEKPNDFKSYADLCRALKEATGDTQYDQHGQSGKVVLDRCRVQYQLVEAVDSQDNKAE